MDTFEIAAATREPRRDGWTSQRRARFLESLAAVPNVRRACASAGLSAEAAYRLRRRDPGFARAWRTALLQGRDARAAALIAALPERARRSLPAMRDAATWEAERRAAGVPDGMPWFLWTASKASTSRD